MANLIFYPYQLEDGRFIDKITGREFGMWGNIDLFPPNMTPYKTPKNYSGGGGVYKSINNAHSFIYFNDYPFLKSIENFTIYFWEYDVNGTNSYDQGGHILTFDDSNGHYAFCVCRNQYVYGAGNAGSDIYQVDKTKWTFHEYSFKQNEDDTYTITIFYQGKKQYIGTVAAHFIKQNRTVVGNWDHAPNYLINGFYGYIYDLSIYDDILHTEDYDLFPMREMNYEMNYSLYQNEHDMYGIKKIMLYL